MTETFVIFRSGSNQANQRLCNRAVVWIADAGTAEQAIAEARGAGITVYANQRLEAVRLEELGQEDRGLYDAYFIV